MSLHPVDVAVGKKLRQRRTMLGMSQEELGIEAGVTFQQIQKYEKGLNRVGASRLFELAQILSCNVAYFFEDLENLTTVSEEGFEEEGASFETEKLSNKEVLSLMRSYNSIDDKDVRRKINDLIRSLSTDN